MNRFPPNLGTGCFSSCSTNTWYPQCWNANQKKKRGVLWCHHFYTLLTILTKYKKCEGWLNDCLCFKQDNFWNFEQSWPNRNLIDNLISRQGYLQDNLDLVLHNLQADADGLPWSTIIINNFNSWPWFGKALPNHSQPWLTKMLFHKPVVNHAWLIMVWELSFVKPWSTMVDWGAISQTYGWSWFDETLLKHGQPWLFEVPFHKPLVDHGLGKLCQPWLILIVTFSW